MLGNKNRTLQYCRATCGAALSATLRPQSPGEGESRKGRWKLQLEVCSSSVRREGALPGKGGAKGKAAEVCGSPGGVEGSTFGLRCWQRPRTGEVDSCLAGAAFLHPAVAGDHRRGKWLPARRQRPASSSLGSQVLACWGTRARGRPPLRPAGDLSTVLCAWDRPAGARWGCGDFVPLLSLPFSLPSVCPSVRLSVSLQAFL